MSQSLNFVKQDLRDRSFIGKNLIGADFSGADIRGCNFSHSQLKSANFANVLTGRSQRQTLSAGVILFLMSLMFASTATIAAILLITFSLTFIFGLQIVNREALYWVALVAIVIFSVGFAIVFTSCFIDSFSISGAKWFFIAIPISLITAFASGFLGSTFAKILVAGAFNAITSSLRLNSVSALMTFLAIEPLQIFGSLYLFRLTIHLMRTNFGTKFQRADLTNASFENAKLVNCNFSYAIMNEVNLQQAKILRCKFPPNFTP